MVRAGIGAVCFKGVALGCLSVRGLCVFPPGQRGTASVLEELWQLMSVTNGVRISEEGSWGRMEALLEGGVRGCWHPVAGSCPLHGTMHAVEELPVLSQVTLVLPKEAASPQGVPHQGAAAG